MCRRNQFARENLKQGDAEFQHVGGPSSSSTAKADPHADAWNGLNPAAKAAAVKAFLKASKPADGSSSSSDGSDSDSGSTSFSGKHDGKPCLALAVIPKAQPPAFWGDDDEYDDEDDNGLLGCELDDPLEDENQDKADTSHYTPIPGHTEADFEMKDDSEMELHELIGSLNRLSPKVVEREVLNWLFLKSPSMMVLPLSCF